MIAGATEEGYVPVEGGRVWFRRVGAGGVPLLLLHGGPGAGHDYLEPLAALAAERAVIFYDQLGCGRSDAPNDPGLWRIERFVAEVAAVRQALGLTRVHILGQSWGGWLAIEYMLGQPRGVAGLVLASTSASVREFVTEAEKLKAALPAPLYAVLQRHEASGTLDHPDYVAAVEAFYKRHLCRLDPWPEPMLRSMRNTERSQVYAVMNGPNEFIVTGNLKGWDRTARLGEIHAPTLITVGRYDEIAPPCAETLQRGIPGSRLVRFEHSAHAAQTEETGRFLEVVAGFLREADARR